VERGAATGPQGVFILRLRLRSPERSVGFKPTSHSLPGRQLYGLAPPNPGVPLVVYFHRFTPTHENALLGRPERLVHGIDEWLPLGVAGCGRHADGDVVDAALPAPV
jgi:hypothetical protein